jgi:hypothetical protein
MNTVRILAKACSTTMCGKLCLPINQTALKPQGHGVRVHGELVTSLYVPRSNLKQAQNSSIIVSEKRHKLKYLARIH